MVSWISWWGGGGKRLPVRLCCQRHGGMPGVSYITYVLASRDRFTIVFTRLITRCLVVRCRRLPSSVPCLSVCLVCCRASSIVIVTALLLHVHAWWIDSTDAQPCRRLTAIEFFKTNLFGKRTTWRLRPEHNGWLRLDNWTRTPTIAFANGSHVCECEYSQF